MDIMIRFTDNKQSSGKKDLLSNCKKRKEKKTTHLFIRNERTMQCGWKHFHIKADNVYFSLIQVELCNHKSLAVHWEIANP